MLITVFYYLILDLYQEPHNEGWFLGIAENLVELLSLLINLFHATGFFLYLQKKQLSKFSAFV